MKMYTSGIAVPKLGSPKDNVLRRYMADEAAKERSLAKFALYASLTNISSETQRDSLMQEWYDFMEYSTGRTAEELGISKNIRDRALIREFEQFKGMRLSLGREPSRDGRQGQLVVKGLPKNLLTTHKQVVTKSTKYNKPR